MKKFLLILTLLFSFQNCFPQLESNLTIGSKGLFVTKDVIDPDATAFISRVEADGGTLELTAKQLSDEIKLLKQVGLYNDAMLINIASGYKAGTLYSVKGDDLTFSRSSIRTRTDEVGDIETLANNVPALEWVGGVLQGVSISPQRTNLLLNSATLSTQNVTVTAVQHVLSFYGTGEIVLSGTHSATLTGVGERVTLAFTPTAGTLTLTVSGTVSYAQLEVSVNGVATSWIPTAGTTVTRIADELAIPSTGYTNVKTYIRGNEAFTHVNGYNYNSHQITLGTHSRFYMFPEVATPEQLTALGVTTVYEDAWVMPIAGNPTNPASPTNGEIRFSATEDLNVVATGDAVLVSNVKSDDGSLRLHTVTVSCPNGGSGSIIVEGRAKVRSLGNHNGVGNPNLDYYTGTDATAPRLTWNINDAPTLCEKIRQITDYANILPTTGNTALPTGLTYLYLRGANINWTYTGSLPTGLTYVLLAGANINWTGNVLGNPSTPKPNMTFFQLLNFRNPSDNMDYADLISILNSILDNVGTVPTTILIHEQIPANVTAINAATPDEFGSDPERAKYLINLIKSTKGVTTFTLNTTDI